MESGNRILFVGFADDATSGGNWKFITGVAGGWNVRRKPDVSKLAGDGGRNRRCESEVRCRQAQRARFRGSQRLVAGEAGGWSSRSKIGGSDRWSIRRIQSPMEAGNSLWGSASGCKGWWKPEVDPGPSRTVKDAAQAVSFTAGRAGGHDCRCKSEVCRRSS
jgi:hypothetical protein